jgi:protein-S-isoprenylcysteine O-methyltransferase Ste14
MTNEVLFRVITLALIVAALSISIYFRRKAERQGNPMRTAEGRGLVAVLRLMGLIVVLPLCAYLVNPDWITWARFTLPDWVRWSAALVGILMVPLIYWIFASIGDNISPTQATRQRHSLITHGPYRWVRHPLYSAGMVFCICLAVISSLWWLFAGMTVPLLILLLRTRREEARLIETFGDDYREYMKCTGQFLPRLG